MSRTSPETETAEDWERRIKEKVWASECLTAGEWVYLVGVFHAANEAEARGVAQTQQQWRPFHPNDWHNSTFCYPCVVVAPDGEVGTPCDPWTLPPDNDWTGWVCCPLPDDYASRLTVSDTSTLCTSAASNKADATSLEAVTASPDRSEGRNPVTFPYQQTFDAIAAATSLYPDKHDPSGISISVRKFEEAFNGHRDASPVSSPDRSSK